MVWNLKQTAEQKPNINYELTLITPELATDLLKLNTKNRKISKVYVSIPQGYGERSLQTMETPYACQILTYCWTVSKD